jgi:tetraacyldisaccharide 4'-kinase
MRWIEGQWQKFSPVTLLLSPLAALYCFGVGLRRLFYRLGLFSKTKISVPVIVVGNVTVGGTGKTPTALWLAQFLKANGYRPGIVSRGYKGRIGVWPFLVTPASEAVKVGDEPLLLARRAACPVVVDPKRARGAQALVDAHGCNVVITDDGLQHWALARDIEIAVVDGARRFGNGLCLPAGPLRERRARLKTVDFVLAFSSHETNEIPAKLEPDRFINLRTNEPALAEQFRPNAVHAVAGIGHPKRFFDTLESLGLSVIPHAFPDHHGFVQGDFDFAREGPVLMTEKDAVKCQAFAKPDWWALRVNVQLPPTFGEKLLSLLKERSGG